MSSSLQSWLFSLLLHGGLLVLFFGFLCLEGLPPLPKTTVDVQVIERAVARPATPPSEQRHARTKPKNPPHAVFGVSRRAVVAENSPVSVKPGNTLAKPPDRETLKPEDADSLPAPVDEFLVTQMPVLVDEVRIPYPPEARRKGIAGAVVMDLLIDDRGKVREAKLITGPAEDLNRAALAAVTGFHFKPALVEGKSVTVRIHYAYRFILEN